jgi:hypothetical protein
MVSARSKRSQASAFDRLEKIFMTGRMQRSEYLQYANLLLSGADLTDHQRERLGRLFDHLRLGRIQLLD